MGSNSATNSLIPYLSGGNTQKYENQVNEGKQQLKVLVQCNSTQKFTLISHFGMSCPLNKLHNIFCNKFVCF